MRRIADMDFETYSEAGYVWADGKWKGSNGAKSGIAAVGAMQYSLHHSTEVICLAYDLKDGVGKRLWIPGMGDPTDLFDYLSQGGLVEAHNCAFEHHIWNNVCTRRYGWSRLPYQQLRDSMAKCRAYALPPSLDKAAKVMQVDAQKDEDGKRLIKKFSVPRNPTAKDKRTRILPDEDMQDAINFYSYCVKDIEAEEALSDSIPDLPPEELEFWINTVACNLRGVGVRHDEIESCISILEQAYERYNAELRSLTNGFVPEATKVQQIIAWLAARGVYTDSLDDAAITSLLKGELDDDARRVLEIRSMVGSASAKKVYAMKRIATPDGRLCDLFNYHGSRTGRDTGQDVQPQNMPKAGPKIQWCAGCGKPSGLHHTDHCPHCGGAVPLLCTPDPDGWSWKAVDHAIEAIKTKSLDWVEYLFGNAVLTVSGCIRGLFVAAPGKQLICSDYSAIEAVVLAALAGEQWRLDAFHAKQDIYYVGASKITGIPYDDYVSYKKEHGKHHPDRQKIGKVSELASGYAGWVGAWKNFGADKFYNDDEIKQLIVKWREASPSIVEFWGGQTRNRQPEFAPYGCEGAFVMAILYPGHTYSVRGLDFFKPIDKDALHIRLLSGRLLTYHRPRLSPSSRFGSHYSISFEGYNTNPLMGRIGWVRMETYAGKIVENIVQAVSRDILSAAVNNLERQGYPCVLRVHDEIASEVDEGFGSVEEFEGIMGSLPKWAEGWPVRASGGWIGKRYRKD